MPNLLRRRPDTEPADPEPAALPPSPRADGCYIDAGGPTLEQMQDQSPDNPWRVAPESLPFLLAPMTDPVALYKIADVEWVTYHNDHGQGSGMTWACMSARTRAGLPLIDRIGQYSTVWPDGVDPQAQGRVYWVFDRLRERADQDARAAARAAKWAAEDRERGRCVVCGELGATRRLRRDMEGDDWKAMHPDCRRAVETERNTRAHTARTDLARRYLETNPDPAA